MSSKKSTIKPLLACFASMLAIGWLEPQLTEGVLAKALGIGGTFIKVIADMGKSLIGGKFTDSFKKIKDPLPESNYLAKAIIQAFNRSMQAIRNDFIAAKAITDRQIQDDLSFFTDNLFDIFNDEEQVNLDFLPADAQLKADDFLQFFFASKKISYPRYLDADEIRAFFIEGFKSRFPAFFLEEIQLNEQARTEYFKYLLELSITNQETLRTQLAAINALAIRTNMLLEEWADRDKLAPIVQYNIQYRHEITERFDKLTQLIDRRLEPKLDTNILPTDRDDPHDDHRKHTHQIRLHYKTRYTSFVGREPELSALWDFLDTDRRFAWWIVTGPAGAGKSRLAQEFSTLARNEGYHAGFYDLQPGDVEDARIWEKWEFSCPTLIVIDYALAKQEKLARLIETLVKRSPGSHDPRIRLLLLDREVSNEWEEYVKTQPELSYSRYTQQGPSLAIADMQDRHLWMIIRQVFQESGLEIVQDEQVTMARLAELDPQKRPLYAFFMAVALCEGADVRNWNVDKLLDYHMSRLENKIWKPQPGYEAHSKPIKRLLVANCLTQGLPIEGLKELNTTLNKQDPDLIHLYSRISDTKKDKDGRVLEWLGVLPDIQGEYFILKELTALLKSYDPVAGRALALDMLKAAWVTKPESAWFMSWLCWDDFRSDFPEATALLIDRDFLEQLPLEAVRCVCLLYFRICTKLVREPSQIEEGWAFYERLKHYAFRVNTQGAARVLIGAAAGISIPLSNDGNNEARLLELHEMTKLLAPVLDEAGAWICVANTLAGLLLLEKNDRPATAILPYYNELVRLAITRKDENILRAVPPSALVVAEDLARMPGTSKQILTLYKELKRLFANEAPATTPKQLYQLAELVIRQLSKEKGKEETAWMIYQDLKKMTIGISGQAIEEVKCEALTAMIKPEEKVLVHSKRALAALEELILSASKLDDPDTHATLFFFTLKFMTTFMENRRDWPRALALFEKMYRWIPSTGTISDHIKTMKVGFGVVIIHYSKPDPQWAATRFSVYRQIQAIEPATDPGIVNEQKSYAASFLLEDEGLIGRYPDQLILVHADLERLYHESSTPSIRSRLVLSTSHFIMHLIKVGSQKELAWQLYEKMIGQYIDDIDPQALPNAPDILNTLALAARRIVESCSAEEAWVSRAIAINQDLRRLTERTGMWQVHIHYLNAAFSLIALLPDLPERRPALTRIYEEARTLSHAGERQDITHLKAICDMFFLRRLFMEGSEQAWERYTACKQAIHGLIRDVPDMIPVYAVLMCLTFHSVNDPGNATAIELIDEAVSLIPRLNEGEVSSDLTSAICGLISTGLDNKELDETTRNKFLKIQAELHCDPLPVGTPLP